MLRLALRLHDELTRLSFWAAGIAAAYLTFVTAWEVVARYVLRSPTGWAPDTSAVAFAFITFLAAPMLTSTSGHAAMTFIVEQSRPGVALWMTRFCQLTGVTACGLCTWFGAVETHRLFVQGVTMIAVTPIPKWLVVGAMVYAFSSMALYFLRHFAASFAARQQATDGAG